MVAEGGGMHDSSSGWFIPEGEEGLATSSGRGSMSGPGGRDAEVEAFLPVPGQGGIVVRRVDDLGDQDLDDRASVRLRKKGGEMAAAVERPGGEMQLLSQFNGPGDLETEYKISMPKSFRVEVLPGNQGVAFEDERGQLVAGVAPAWAVTSSGNSLLTRFSWDEKQNVLTQEVEEVGLRPADYPVVTDPYLGKRLYHKSTVTGTPQRYKVNAFVTAWGRTWTGRATFSYHKDEVRSQLGARANWYTGSIREQHYWLFTNEGVVG
ncbi:hypothetical protein I6I18_12255 [Kytococcus sedentarius]|nr:hypothetical protein [Kytococcus sedentarius]QQB63752.1 hypothetical protein I6I18_12255 [Kytococcus sedentarius]